MPTMVQALSHLPTVFFWLIVLLLIISELIGKFASSVRPRFRRFAVTVFLMLCAWYAAETAHSLALTTPNFAPWSQFYTLTSLQ